jgi:hypothetical protein
MHADGLPLLRAGAATTPGVSFEHVIWLCKPEAGAGTTIRGVADGVWGG